VPGFQQELEYGSAGESACGKVGEGVVAPETRKYTDLMGIKADKIGQHQKGGYNKQLSALSMAKNGSYGFRIFSSAIMNEGSLISL
jgi:hypothetical protein